jgi:hypothetical protein
MNSMTPPTQQTEIRVVFYRCRIGRSDLDRIFGVAVEGISPDAITVSTQMDSTRYSQQTLEELISAIQVANPMPHSTAWSNLRLEATDESNRRRVKLLIEDDRVSVELSGEDPTWTYGQSARFREMLTALGGTEGSRPRGYAHNVFMACVATVFLTVYMVDIARTPPSEIRILDRPIATIAIALVIAFVCNSFLETWANQAALDVKGEVQRGSWWSRLSTTLKVSTITAVAGIVAAVAAVVSAWSDV